MASPLRIAIAGLGTVGAGTVKILQENAALIAERAGRTIQIVAVNARDKGKDRGVDIGAYRFEEDALTLASAADVDVVVELIGGDEGVAKTLVETALKNGKHVVTANKALLAHHGLALAELAEKNKVVLAFEAAVAGGIPIIKTLREGLAANRLSRVVGILNGTSNYILTSMQYHGTSFNDALAEAQKKGYAEADPSFDIDGIDTAHKLSIITSLAFACRPQFSGMVIEGIRGVTQRDMQFASELGYCIKLLGITEKTTEGIAQRVYPCLVPKDSPIGVDGVYNGIVAEGHAVGRVIIEGRGAGAGPTASSVIADVMDIARGVSYPAFTLPAQSLKKTAFIPAEKIISAAYLRMGVEDKPGVLAEITSIFGREGISLRSFLQHSHQPGEAVQLVITTHDAPEAAIASALQKIAALPFIVEAPHRIRIVEF